MNKLDLIVDDRAYHMNGIASTFLPALILLALIFAPTGMAVGTVLYIKRLESKDAKRSPLNEKLLHQPGSQARQKAHDISESITERIVQLLLVGPMTMLVLLLPRVRWASIQFGLLEMLVISGAVILVAWLIRKIVLLRKERKAWEAGYLGELATAQALNKLTSHGCLVFHDLPTNRANIDHVVITPKAVFAVETKWRSKGDGKAGAEVRYDGEMLRFPGYRTDQPLHQIRGLAQWLGKYLHGETGQAVRIIPVVALPGWYVTLEKGSATADVKVINEKWQKTFLDIGGPEISQEQLVRIANAVTKQYPELVT